MLVIAFFPRAITNAICNSSMRFFFTLTIYLFCLNAIASDIDKETATALEYINQGYVQYGFEQLKRASATNSIAAQFYVAICYEYGIGVEKNQTEAFKMYRKAAERGLPDAMYHIASFYEKGIVVNQDATREREWLQRFQKKGGVFILPDLISIYNEGLKHTQNYAVNPNSPNHSVAQNSRTNNTPKQPIKNVTIVQSVPKPIDYSEQKPINKPTIESKMSDVDKEIPICKQNNETIFILIIANEDYRRVDNVPYAANDGKIFAEYCKKTLGVPEKNLHLLTNATLGDMKYNVSMMKQIAEAFEGEAQFIFYYAGHGLPAENQQDAFLLPVDGYGADGTGYSVNELYNELGALNAKSVVVLLDACFSGAKRDGGMVASARGVAIKAKQTAPKGNMVVLSAAQGDETAYPYKEQGHGLFTYYLLKKLNETKGNVTLGELADYIISGVKKTSIVENGKLQTPTVIPSATMDNTWRNMKLK